MKSLGIRVDASEFIGIGHLFRCLRIAEQAHNSFNKITFIAYKPSKFYCQIIAESGFDLINIADKNDLKFLENYNCDYLIKDHYGLDIDWESSARAKVEKLIVMDDRIDTHHVCDIYINQNPYTISPTSLPMDCLILSGLRYAILPKAILNLEHRPLNNNILVSFGGSDPTNEIQKCLEAFKDFEQLQFHFIGGKENPDNQEISDICSHHEHYTYHHFIDNIHEIASNAYACITSGGTLLRELIYMQVPCYLITNNNIQIPFANYYDAHNAVFYAGNYDAVTAHDIQKSFKTFVTDKALMRTYKHNMAALIDGKGINRIINNLIAPPIWLTSATAQHCKTIYKWRNHPATRQYSANSKKIDYDEHKQWFKNKLADKNSYFFIAYNNNEEIGVIRFDSAKNDFIVSLYLSPYQHGKGYGAFILLQGIKALKEKGLTSIKLIANILDNNRQSQYAFQKAGFTQGHNNQWYKELP
jgi:UDP-2,4-diacetamido-2,4,6-trideoxy-beta-L-altropyranose hydrolase